MARATSTTSRRAGRKAGFTLVEALIASTVLAVTVVAVAGPVTASYQQTRSAQQASAAISLARQLLDEITAKPLVDPTDFSTSLGPEPGEATRALFDNIDDYANYHDSTNALTRQDGTPIDYAGNTVYERFVSIEYRQVPDGPAAASGDYAMVMVRVSAASEQVLTLRRLVAAFPRSFAVVQQ